jgi:hypothetical protein
LKNSNAELLVNINSRILLEWEGKDPSMDQGKVIGNIFSRMSNYLKMYTTYCANQPMARAMLAELKKKNDHLSIINARIFLVEYCRINLFVRLVRKTQEQRDNHYYPI